MSLPKNELTSDDPKHLPPARRRRARRLLVPLDFDERSDFLASLANRASASVGFFLFSFLSGLVIGAAFLIDHPSLILLGALLTPLMAPTIGISLGTMIGSLAYFFRSLVGLTIGLFFALTGGLVAGFATQFWAPGAASQYSLLYAHTQFSWIFALLAGASAVITAGALVQSSSRARLPSIALAYSLYTPLVAAGFGLTSGLPHLFPDGLVVYLLHFALATLLGSIALGLMGYRPPTIFGYTLGGVLVLIGILLTFGVSGIGFVVGGQVALPTLTSTVTSTPVPTLTSTVSPEPPTLTPTNTATQTTHPPTSTLTPSLVPPTLTPAPLYAVVDVNPEVDSGARIRSEPGGATLTVLSNGILIQLLPERVEVEGTEWVKVITAEGVEGWMVASLLTVATPAPNWSP